VKSNILFDELWIFVYIYGMKNNISKYNNEDDSIWLSSKRVFSIYSFSKGKLYRLYHAGKIHSTVDRKYGAKKGSRLWSKESIDLYMKSLGDGKESKGDPNYVYQEVERYHYPVIVYKRIPKFEPVYVSF
jgi:hypothetical protein